MKINEWEIWHTYTTYLQISGINLEINRTQIGRIWDCSMCNAPGWPNLLALS